MKIVKSEYLITYKLNNGDYGNLEVEKANRICIKDIMQLEKCIAKEYGSHAVITGIYFLNKKRYKHKHKVIKRILVRIFKKAIIRRKFERAFLSEMKW